MLKVKLRMAIISSLIMMSFVLRGISVSEAGSKTTMVGLVSFSANSNAVVGMIISTNRGMEKIVSYQIPPLTGESPYTFHAPYVLAVTTDDSSNQTSGMNPRNGSSHDGWMGNRKGSDSMMDDEDDSDHMDNGHGRGSGNMMDDEDDSGHMEGEWSHARWSYDTYITLANTSAQPITINATFYDNNGNIVKETSFDLTGHQTIQKSVFKILGLR
jgi:hypothetical protein